MELVSKEAAVAQREDTINLPQWDISSVNASTRARALLRAVFFCVGQVNTGFVL